MFPFSLKNIPAERAIWVWLVGGEMLAALASKTLMLALLFWCVPPHPYIGLVSWLFLLYTPFALYVVFLNRRNTQVSWLPKSLTYAVPLYGLAGLGALYWAGSFTIVNGVVAQVFSAFRYVIVVLLSS